MDLPFLFRFSHRHFTHRRLLSRNLRSLGSNFYSAPQPCPSSPTFLRGFSLFSDIFIAHCLTASLVQWLSDRDHDSQSAFEIVGVTALGRWLWMGTNNGSRYPGRAYPPSMAGCVQQRGPRENRNLCQDRRSFPVGRWDALL